MRTQSHPSDTDPVGDKSAMSQIAAELLTVCAPRWRSRDSIRCWKDRF